MITNNEITFIQDVLERAKRRYNGHDVVEANAKLHNVDIYNLQIKLDELKS